MLKYTYGDAGQYNEDAWLGFDYILAQAAMFKIRVRIASCMAY